MNSIISDPLLSFRVFGGGLGIFIFLLIYFWVCWVFCCPGFSLIAPRERGTLHSKQCRGLSLLQLFLLLRTSSRALSLHSVVAASALNPGLWSRDSIVVPHRVSCFSSMWDLPEPQIEPMCPALTGGFFTTEPSGKPSLIDF